MGSPQDKGTPQYEVVRAMKKKARLFTGAVEAPFVLAVRDEGRALGDDESWLTVLYGPMSVSFVRDLNTGRVGPGPINPRQGGLFLQLHRDTALRKTRGVERTRLSGVLAGRIRCMESAYSFDLTLYHNPYAAHPVNPMGFPTARQYVPRHKTSELEWMEPRAGSGTE